MREMSRLAIQKQFTQQSKQIETNRVTVNEHLIVVLVVLFDQCVPKAVGVLYNVKIWIIQL